MCIRHFRLSRGKASVESDWYPEVQHRELTHHPNTGTKCARGEVRAEF
jgi:hypothetical protein